MTFLKVIDNIYGYFIFGILAIKKLGCFIIIKCICVCEITEAFWGKRYSVFRLLGILDEFNSNL